MLANGFAVFFSARYCNLQRLSTPMEAKQGAVSRSRPNLRWQPCRHVESLRAVAFFTWRLERDRGSQFADIP
jgi:hypothetical protein